MNRMEKMMTRLNVARRRADLILMMACLAPLAGCSAPSAAQPAATETAVKATSAQPADRPLAAERRRLLDLAFDAATAIPVEPHLKDRSRAQEEVFDAYLELGQPRAALEQSKRIENWRRGAALADLAHYDATHDARACVEPLLEEAQKIADTTEDWRRDTIRVKIAKTHEALGDDVAVARMTRGLVPSEEGKILEVQAVNATPKDFAGQIKSVQALLGTQQMDIQQNALNGCAQLFDTFYDDAEKRQAAEDQIKQGWGPLPLVLRIKLLERLAESALAHKDEAKATALTREARAIVDSAEWQIEDRMPMVADLANLAGRAGDKESARRDLAELMESYERGKEKIVDIWRAGALRPIAEAYAAFGDDAAARKVYALALEDGAHNPNGRPRATDLAATCRSMAVAGVTPDDALWQKIQSVREGLKAPW